MLMLGMALEEAAYILGRAGGTTDLLVAEVDCADRLFFGGREIAGLDHGFPHVQNPLGELDIDVSKPSRSHDNIGADAPFIADQRNSNAVIAHRDLRNYKTTGAIGGRADFEFHEGEIRPGQGLLGGLVYHPAVDRACEWISS